MEDTFIVQINYSSSNPTQINVQNNVCGGGLFIEHDTIITCAHVLNVALGLDHNNTAKPNGQIKIRFTHNEDLTEEIVCQIREWYYNGSPETDFAILQFIFCSQYEKLLRLNSGGLIAISDDLWGHQFKAFGYPVSYGIWAKGILYSKADNNLYQLESKELTHFFSGFPVYDFNIKSYVGIIGYGSKEKTFSYMLSFKAISRISSEIKQISRSILADIDFNMPDNIIMREGLITLVNSALKSENKIAFLLGPSGYGKSILSKIYYLGFNGPKHFYNCKSSNEIPLVNDNDLVVIDEIYEEHPIFNWIIGKINCQIIVNTKSRFIPQKIIRNRNLLFNLNPANYFEENIIEIVGFSFEEAKKLFLFGGCGPDLISDEEIKKYVHNTDGCPMAIRGLIKNLCKSGCPEIIWDSTGNFIDTEKVFRQIVQNDLELTKSNVNEILTMLSNVPFVGMNENVISHVVEKTVIEINEALSKVISLGYVTILKNNKYGSLYTVHDLLRKVYKIDENSTIEDRRKRRTWDKKYFDHLVRNRNDLDILSTIDALVSGLRSVFKIIDDKDAYNEEDIRILESVKSIEDIPESTYVKYKINSKEEQYFDRALKYSIEIINDIFKTREISSHQQILVIDFFKNAIHTASCSELIALGHAFSGMPKNPVLGTTIWEGVNNYDSWASGACFRAAIHHWSNYDDYYLQEMVIPKIKTWIDNTRRSSMLDLDLASAIGGLCMFGCCQYSKDLLLSNPYRKRIDITLISDLTLILYYVEKNDKEELHEILNSIWKYVSATNTRHLASKYILSKTNINTNAYDNCHISKSDKDFALTLGRAAFNNNFMNFALANGAENNFYI